MSSSSKEVSKFEKEKTKLIQDKCQGLLNEMLRDDDNKYCVDCDAKGPRWASWNLGIFLCIRCAGIHRNLGVHISRVKSVNLDSWTPEQVVTMQQMGNSRARAVYEANLPDNFRRPQTDVALENFIRAKYEHTKYIAQEWVKPAPPRVDWNSEIEEQIRRKKEKKNTDAAAAAVLPRLGPAAGKSNQLKSISTNNKPSHPPPIGKIEVGKMEAQSTPQQPPQPTSASDDLLGLTTDTPASIISDPFASPVKSTNTPLPAATTAGTTSSTDDLGGVFTAPDQNSQQKMTKESILKLYGSLGGGGGGGSGFPGGGGGGMVPQPAANNPFASSVGQFGGAGATMNNPFPPQQQQGMFSNDLIGNNGFGGSGGLMMGGNSQMGTSNLSQLQQGLFSLNLTSPPQQAQSTPQQFATPHAQNSNLVFNNTPTQPSTNLNMLRMNNVDGGAPGNFFVAPPQSGGASLPNMMMPPQPQQQQFMQQQQTQQNQIFNQFQQAAPIGLFQNGGGGGLGGLGSLGSTAGSGTTAGNTNHVNVDLLWK